VVEMRDFVAMLVPAESASPKAAKAARVNLTASVPASLAGRMRERAKERRVSVSELIASLITEHLANV
jgi:Ribbon-helix-helix protein, copG family